MKAIVSLPRFVIIHCDRTSLTTSYCHSNLLLMLSILDLADVNSFIVCVAVVSQFQRHVAFLQLPQGQSVLIAFPLFLLTIVIHVNTL